ncbi:hypothetical protein [Pseudomonas gingeri]|uniref:Phytanoyl-CoA dioxygenase (PhyH) n=1 Tax=Pseudomonas gingeri TaxID=117681 RepID=A0A7Y7WEK6_9PSED|nr:hypothetical protein [Pseudomonas gingeri]NWB47736.1 hypothetical protein [Pseudomonas gingeri]
MINEQFQVSEDQVITFRRQGFLFLKGFYNKDITGYLKSTIGERISAPTDKYQSGFSRLAFDMYDGDPMIASVIQDDHFKRVMNTLTGKTLFFAQALSFELEKNKNKGFPWHIGTQSFGYHQAEDYGCTVWAPLVNIDPKGQRGGLAYVPKDAVSGAFMYEHIDPSIFQLLSERIERGEETTIDEFMHLRDGPLNDPAIKKLLDHFAVEDEFEVGDALIFDKNVIHRSIMLEDGPIDSRAAFVMRFFCETSTYDYRRAHDLEIPREYFKYSGPTRFHLEVAKEQGELLVNSPFFKGQEYRSLKTSKTS